jgi:hypothetical protein
MPCEWLAILPLRYSRPSSSAAAAEAKSPPPPPLSPPGRRGTLPTRPRLHTNVIVTRKSLYFDQEEKLDIEESKLLTLQSTALHVLRRAVPCRAACTLVDQR